MDDHEHYSIKEQQNRIARNIRHKELFKLSQNGSIPQTRILWHEHIREVDLMLQRDKFDARLLKSGFEILTNVNIERLFDHMSKADAEMFRKKQLYSRSFNEMQISNVWDCWLQGTKLIPPTIFIFDRNYMDTLNLDYPPSRACRPVDGKHRLNAAYCLGATEIPIMVWREQFEKIKKKLQHK